MQAIHQCALINPHSGNNLRSHYQDLVSLTSMFRSVGQPGILPNANYSEVLCQLENTVFDLNKTVSGFYTANARLQSYKHFMLTLRV